MHLRTALVLVLGLASLDQRALAQSRDQRALIQRVEVEPYFLGTARVRVYASILKLSGGSIIEGFKPEELVLNVNDKPLKHPPGILKFAHTGEPVDLVMVMQVTKSYAEPLEQLDAPVAAMLRDLGKTLKGSQVGIVSFGAEVRQVVGLTSPDAAARAWQRKVLPDEDAAPPKLKEAVERAKKILERGKARRRLMVVIGDGRNEDVPGREEEFARSSKLSKDLVAKDIVIDTIGYDPTGRRALYMINLGQLSRTTNGFPRLAKEPESLPGAIDSLAAELKSEMVLTYFVPIDDVAGKSVKLTCRSAKCGYEKGESEVLASNVVRSVRPACGATACQGMAVCVDGACRPQTMKPPGLPLAAWLAIIGFVAGGAGVGVVVLRRRKKGAAPAPVPLQPDAPPPSGAAPALPDFSNLPYFKDYQAKLPQGYAPPTPPAAPAVPGRVSSLLVLSGPRAGQHWPLRHGFTIGKAAGVDLAIDDSFASGRHAQIQIDAGGGVTLVDLGSTNGTFVNGVRTQALRLTHGASIRIGQTELRFLQG